MAVGKGQMNVSVGTRKRTVVRGREGAAQSDVSLIGPPGLSINQWPEIQQKGNLWTNWLGTQQQHRNVWPWENGNRQKAAGGHLRRAGGGRMTQGRGLPVARQKTTSTATKWQKKGLLISNSPRLGLLLPRRTALCPWPRVCAFVCCLPRSAASKSKWPPKPFTSRLFLLASKGLAGLGLPNSAKPSIFCADRGNANGTKPDDPRGAVNQWARLRSWHLHTHGSEVREGEGMLFVNLLPYFVPNPSAKTLGRENPIGWPRAHIL